jgi:hypothetical protein
MWLCEPENASNGMLSLLKTSEAMWMVLRFETDFCSAGFKKMRNIRRGRRPQPKPRSESLSGPFRLEMAIDSNSDPDSEAISSVKESFPARDGFAAKQDELTFFVYFLASVVL